MVVPTLLEFGHSAEFHDSACVNHSHCTAPHSRGPKQGTAPRMAAEAHVHADRQEQWFNGRKTESNPSVDDMVVPPQCSTHISSAREIIHDASPVPGIDLSTLDPFSLTRSRVLRLNKPWLATTDNKGAQYVKAMQATLWQVGDGDGLQSFVSDSILWVVFRTHNEACAALRTANPTLIFSPATERELEATHNLHQVTWRELEDMSMSADRGPSAASYSSPWQYPNDSRPDVIPASATGARDTLQDSCMHELYNISSNPPNPKLSFRAGDWWCPVAHCAAHNFGRNVGCIKCGTPRVIGDAQLGSGLNTIRTSPPPQVSPRFISQVNPLDEVGHMLETRIAPQHGFRPQLANTVNHGPTPPPTINIGSKAPVPQYPILTPSGSALSAGGRVRNVSNDPLSPCIIYWPDNEPLPEAGQVRPFGSAVVQFPPIINTGNKGAAEKQPGDWICQKCKYLNWRRRKVCQTCFPYAEGNGDSISAAVQAERIALLAGVLNKADPSPVPQRQLPVPPTGYTGQDSSHIWQDPTFRVIPRQEMQSKIQQIYQTPDGVTPYPPSVRMDYVSHSAPPNSRNLLPSFLQDIVTSPALSPAGSTSSSETGLEDSFAAFDISDSMSGARMRRHPYSTSSSSSVSSASIASIWKLDGEESKTLGLGNVSPIEKVPTAFSALA